MKLDDPDLLRKEPSWMQPVGFYGTKQYKSLYCRNNYHHRCKMASCNCDCHEEAAKQLAHHLQENGAVRVDAMGFRICYATDCGNRVSAENDLFCAECNRGNSPSVRAAKAETLEKHLTRPL